MGFAVAVTGASGFVARRLMYRLRGSCRVVPVSRPGYGAGLARALRGCDAVAHLAGSGSPGGRGYGNAEVTEAVARAASEVGAKTLVYLSGLGVSARSTSAYFASKLEAEKLVRSSGIPYTVLRPSYIVGGQDYLSRCLRAQARRGRILVPGDGGCMQPVLADDAVSVIEKALRGGRFAGRVLDLVGPRRVRFAEYVRQFARRYPDARIERVPLAEALRAAVSGDFPYSVDDLCILLGGFEGDYGRLRRAYGADLSPVTGPRRARAVRRGRSLPR